MRRCAIVDCEESVTQGSPYCYEHTADEDKPKDYFQKIEITTCANRRSSCQSCTRQNTCRYAEGL